MLHICHSGFSGAQNVSLNFIGIGVLTKITFAEVGKKQYYFCLSHK